MARDAVDWLYGLQHLGIKLGLANIRTLLGLLGHPESAYPSVLVAGTNGKGSVAAMMDAVLLEAGYRPGLFTSPHLVRLNERIRIAGRDISDADLDRHLAALRHVAARGLVSGALDVHPSFFEVLTATALSVFQEAGVHVAVLEVGMGGRLDATNAVPARMSVVVTVDLDHVNTLGPTLDRIAGEKAGVVKPGRPLVTGVVQEDALEVLRRKCREEGAALVEARQVAEWEPGAGGTFRLRTKRALYEDLRVALEGHHQVENARVAVVALEILGEILGWTPSPEQVRSGLAAVRWPGRLQWVSGAPPMLLDGAHNPAGAATLASYLDRRGGAPPVMLFGAMRGKLIDRILDLLGSRVEAVVITRPPVRRAAEPEEIAAVARPRVPRVEVEPDPQEALKRARDLAAESGTFVLITGSLYLLGEYL